MEDVYIFLAGVAITAIIAHAYYRKSSSDRPSWSQPLFDKLPDAPVSIERLIELYTEALDEGTIISHPSGYVVCPECGAMPDKFEGWEAADHANDRHYHGFLCTECNYTLTESES